MPLRYPLPIMTFKIVNVPNVLDSSYPDQNLNNILYQLNLDTVTIPGVGTFKNDDTFTLYGAEALEFSKISGTMPVISITNPTPPVANFSGSVTSGDAPLTVTFTDLSTNDPTEWFWTFNGKTVQSNLKTPTFIFDEPGVYTVSLTVSNKGGVSSISFTNYITATDPNQIDDFMLDFSNSINSGYLPVCC